MTQASSRTILGCSRLVRALSELAVEEVADSKQSFAERLGQWLDFADALSLYSTLNAGAQRGGANGSPQASGTLREEFARLRATLANSIATDGIRAAGKARVELPTPEAGSSIESAADFAPYHRYYLAHQRDMAASIAPLRAAARAALCGHSPRLKRLADLDTLMDDALAVRERSLLASVPALLGKRFEALLAAHRATIAETQAEDDPQQWMLPGAWLAGFCKDMQAVLQAELDLRLQPVAGLIAALDNEVTKQQ